MRSRRRSTQAMPEGPDPLGKRALFWAPAQRSDPEQRRGDVSPDLGRRALFSSPAGTDRPAGAAEGAGRRGSSRQRSRVSAASRRLAPATGRRAPAAGRQVAPSKGSRDKAGEPTGAGSSKPRGSRMPLGSGDPATTPLGAAGFSIGGPIVLECSACHGRSEVDMLDYLVLHLPLWLWRPGRGYTRLMRCPACSRRTWLSASWSFRGRT